MLLLFFSCATSTTHLSSPVALDKGEMQFSVANAVTANSAVLSTSYDSGKALYEQVVNEDAELSEEDLRSLLDSGLVWALQFPNSSVELLGRYGLSNSILEGLDVGLRTNFSVWKADLKLQIWEQEQESLAIMVGYARNSSLVSPQVEWLTLTEFSRQDIDVNLIWGRQLKPRIDVYLGPRLIYSKIDTTAKIHEKLQERIPESMAQYNPSQFFFDERMLYSGGTIGGKIGYKRIYLNLELNGFWVDLQPTIWEEQRDHSGLMLSPVIGLSYLTD